MAAVRHCRHCWGDCLGECLLGDTGMCIHGWNSRPNVADAGTMALEPDVVAESARGN